MANLPGGAFAKGRDRIVRIADPGGTRKLLHRTAVLSQCLQGLHTTS